MATPAVIAPDEEEMMLAAKVILWPKKGPPPPLREWECYYAHRFDLATLNLAAKLKAGEPPAPWSISKVEKAPDCSCDPPLELNVTLRSEISGNCKLLRYSGADVLTAPARAVSRLVGLNKWMRTKKLYPPKKAVRDDSSDCSSVDDDSTGLLELRSIRR